MASQDSGFHVLLTGANGFVASHILSILLVRGYAVTATVRSKEKAADVIRRHPSWEGRVEFAIVANFTSAKPFDELFITTKTPFTYIVHTASPLNFGVEDIQKDMIEPAVRGTTEILKSAHHYGGATLKRFVLLGSAVSVMNSFEDITREGQPYTEKNWNPVTAEEAVAKNDTVLGYNVSKTSAESSAWKFMKSESPCFDLAVINPDIIIGPMIHPISSRKSINETNHFAIASFIDGTHKQLEGVTFPFYHFVDVRDVARSHVDALSNTDAGSQRILLISGIISPQLVVNIIRKNFPALRARVPEGNPSEIFPPGVHPTGWDMRLSLDILSKGTKEQSWKYIDLETSVTDAIRTMIEAKVI